MRQIDDEFIDDGYDDEEEDLDDELAMMMVDDDLPAQDAIEVMAIDNTAST